jgi:hypothetical protein
MAGHYASQWPNIAGAAGGVSGLFRVEGTAAPASSVSAAIDLCVSGRPIKAKAADLGLVDEIVAELRSGAVARQRLPPVLQQDPGSQRPGNAATNAHFMPRARQARRIQQSNRRWPSSRQLSAATLPFDEMPRRARIFFKCVVPINAEPIHAFFSERAVSKVAGI